MATAHNNTIGAALERAKHEEWVDTARTGYTYYFNIRWIIQPVSARKVSARVGTPVAAERDDLRRELFCFGYWHIASTSAMICLVVNPFRSMAPDGQVTVQAPHP